MRLVFDPFEPFLFEFFTQYERPFTQRGWEPEEHIELRCDLTLFLRYILDRVFLLFKQRSNEAPFFGMVREFIVCLLVFMSKKNVVRRSHFLSSFSREFLFLVGRDSANVSMVINFS